jgi:hypothetical protein
MMWGDYPALIESSPNDIVTGMAYRACSVRDRERLVRYETAAYRIQGCTLWFDGTWMVGKIFVWNGERDGGRDGLREGDFDSRGWLLKEKEFTD